MSTGRGGPIAESARTSNGWTGGAWGWTNQAEFAVVTPMSKIHSGSWHCARIVRIPLDFK